MKTELEILMTNQLNFTRWRVERIMIIADLKNDNKTRISCIQMLEMFKWWVDGEDNISRHIGIKHTPEDRIRDFIGGLDVYYSIEEIRLNLNSMDLLRKLFMDFVIDH